MLDIRYWDDLQGVGDRSSENAEMPPCITAFDGDRGHVRAHPVIPTRGDQAGVDAQDCENGIRPGEREVCRMEPYPVGFCLSIASCNAS